MIEEDLFARIAAEHPLIKTGKEAPAGTAGGIEEVPSIHRGPNRFQSEPQRCWEVDPMEMAAAEEDRILGLSSMHFESDELQASSTLGNPASR